MSRNLPSTLVLSAALVLASMAGAYAHESAEGPHGGAVVDVAGHHVEFVPSPTEMTFILTAEADAPIASSGAKMKAIVQDAGAYQRLLDIAARADPGEGIRQGLEDAKQGKVRSAREFFADLEATHGITSLI